MTVEKYAKEHGLDLESYDYMQINEIRIGLEKGLDVSQYTNPKYTWMQMEEIRIGLEKGLDVFVYANPEYGWEQMEQIRIGLEEELDVSFYANPNFTVFSMEQIRKRLELEKEYQNLPPLEELIQQANEQTFEESEEEIDNLER